ncbi:MAG: ABC transporter permease [Oligoflexia bacterium]
MSQKLKTTATPRILPKVLLDVLKVQLKNNWVREAVYRTNFITAVGVDLVWIAIEFTLFGVIYANTPTIGGWTQDQVYFFLGVFFSSDALFTIFFQRNFWNFSDLVNRGELDILLTKPVPPLFLALTRWINLTAFSNFGLGLAILFKFAGPAGFEGGWHWFSVVFWLLVGVLSAALIRFTFSIWIFWTERGFTLSRLYYQFFSFATKPDTMYPKWIRYLILSALPFAFIGSIPARALLEGLTLNESLLVAGVLTSFWILNAALWRAGLRRYQSASS